MSVQIKDWFLKNKLAEIGDNRAYAVRTSIMGNEQFVEKETEKAVLVKFPSDFGSVSFWVPKSCLIN